MADACRQCSAPLPDGARFCATCGTPVGGPATPSTPAQSTPNSQVAGERKPVTALFADVVGSVTLAESMDPEDWSVLMSGAVGRMEAAVRHYDGAIAKLLGDGVLALFGAETSHEDDPERAVRAAIEMLGSFASLDQEFQALAGREFAIRIGINTGLALVGTVAGSSADDRGDVSAYGDTVNVAARLQAAATPGHALVTDATWRLVAHVVEGRDLGDLVVKGRAEPVHTHELVGLRATPAPARGLAGLRSPMVGRDGPLDRLRVSVEGVLTEREGRVSIVVGEPGIGKSRLLAELRDEIARQDGVRWSEAQASSLGERSGDDLLRTLVASLTLAAGASRPPDPVVEHFLGRPLEAGSAAVGADLDAQAPELRRMRHLDAVTGLIREVCAQAALVVVLEDLHWADASSVDALIQLLPVIASLPIEVLATTRPDTDTDGWRFVEAAHAQLAADAFEQISLGPLTDRDTRQLVANLLEIDALPDDIRTRILANADGNPFFVEETVRMLLEGGAIVVRDGHWVATEAISSVEIPRTIHSLLLARIDRLDAEPRRCLRVGSVLGREFSARLLRGVQARAGTLPATDEDLAALQGSGLVRMRSEGSTTVLRFRHALVQEAAYDSLLRAERSTLHRAAAEVLESGADQQALADLAATISEHFEAAVEPARSLVYARLAAETAFARYALPESIAHYRRAIRLAAETGAPGEELKELYLRAGRAIELTDRYQEAIAHYSTMVEASRSTGDRRMELAALTAKSISESMATSARMSPEPARQDAAAALELARELGDRRTEATGLWALMLANRSYMGPDTSVPYGLESIAIADEIGEERQAALARQDVARAYEGEGRFREALTLLDASIPYWQRVAELPSLADGLRLRCGIEWQLGDFHSAMSDAAEAWEVDETTRNAWGRVFSRLQHAGLLVELGREEEALPELREAVEIADTTDVTLLRLASRTTLVVTLIERGAFSEARRLTATMTSESQGWPSPMAQVGASVQAWLEASEGNIDAARAALARAAPPEALTFGFGGVRIWSGAVEACLALGDPRTALARVDAVLRTIQPAGAPLWEADARRLRATALLALGDPAGAERELRQALAVQETIGQLHNRSRIVDLLETISVVRG